MLNVNNSDLILEKAQNYINSLRKEFSEYSERDDFNVNSFNQTVIKHLKEIQKMIYKKNYNGEPINSDFLELVYILTEMNEIMIDFSKNNADEFAKQVVNPVLLSYSFIPFNHIGNSLSAISKGISSLIERIIPENSSKINLYEIVDFLNFITYESTRVNSATPFLEKAILILKERVINFPLSVPLETLDLNHRVFRDFLDSEKDDFVKFINKSFFEIQDKENFRLVVYPKFIKTYLSYLYFRDENLKNIVEYKFMEYADDSIRREFYWKIYSGSTHRLFASMSNFPVDEAEMPIDYVLEDFIKENNLSRVFQYLYSLSSDHFHKTINSFQNKNIVYFNYLLAGQYLINIANQTSYEEFAKLFEKFASTIDKHIANTGKQVGTVLFNVLYTLFLLSLRSNNQIESDCIKAIHTIIKENSHLVYGDLIMSRREIDGGIHYRTALKEQILTDLYDSYFQGDLSSKEADEIVNEIKDYIENEFRQFLIREYAEKDSIPTDLHPKIPFSQAILNKRGIEMVDEYINVVKASLDYYLGARELVPYLLTLWVAGCDTDRLAENNIDLTSDKNVISERIKTQLCMVFFNASFAYSDAGLNNRRFSYSCAEGIKDRMLDVLDGRHDGVEILHYANKEANKEQVSEEFQRGFTVRLIGSMLKEPKKIFDACSRLLVSQHCSFNDISDLDITLDKVLLDPVLHKEIVAPVINQLNSEKSLKRNLLNGYTDLVSQSEYFSFKGAYVRGLMKSINCESLNKFYTQISNLDNQFNLESLNILELMLQKKNMQLSLDKCANRLILIKYRKDTLKEQSELEELKMAAMKDLGELKSCIVNRLEIFMTAGINQIIAINNIQGDLLIALQNTMRVNVSLIIGELMSSDIFDNLIANNIKLQVENFIENKSKDEFSKIDISLLDYILDADRDDDINLTKAAGQLLKDLGVIKSNDIYSVNYVLMNINVIAKGNLVNCLKEIIGDLSSKSDKMKISK